MSLLDKVKAAHTVADAVAVIYLDGEAWTQAKAVRDQHSAERLKTDSDLGSTLLKDMEATIAELRTKLEASKVTFTFRSIGQDAYRELMAQHPPDDPTLLWNDATFPPALVAASCVKVIGPDIDQDTMSEEDAAGLFVELDVGQCDELFRGAHQVNKESPKPFGFASIDPAASSVLKSTLASATGESPTPGS